MADLIDDQANTVAAPYPFWKPATLVPVGAIVLSALLNLAHDTIDLWPIPAQVVIAVIVFVFVFWCVFVVLGHAEAVAHHVGEPFGTLVLTVAVTAIEASVIVSFMMHGDPNPTIARESVFSTVMIVCGGIVGLSLVLGGWRHRQQELKQQGTSALLAVVVALSVLTLVLPNFTLAAGPGDFSSLQLIFVSLLCLMLYGSFVFAQMTRHKADFLDDRHAPVQGQHGSASPGLARSLILLAIGLVGIVLLAETIAASLEQGLSALRLPQTDAIVGAFIATLVLLPETLAAIRAAMRNSPASGHRPMITLVKASHVVGYQNGDHVIFNNGEVAFADERIIFVGQGFPGTPDSIIDAGFALLSPGFIDLDALADIDHALIDSWHGPETASGLDWSADYFANRRRDVFSAVDRDFRHEFAFSQLIRNGITTAMPIGGEMHNSWCETYDEWAAAAGIAGRLGLRMYMGPSYRAGVNVVHDDGTRDVLWNEALGNEGFADAVRFAEDFDGAHDGLISSVLLPARIETMTPALLQKTAEAARRLGIKVRLHCLQGQRELEYLKLWHGKSPLDLLEDSGLLGPDLLVPHGIYIGGTSRNPHGNPDDLVRIARSGTTIIHCPMTSIRYGTMMESFERYRAAGVNIAMGTDSYPPDMIRNMDIGFHIPKAIEHRTSAGNAAEIFRAATLGGARALGRDDLGRLALGAMADMVIVDLSDPRIGAVDDPIRTLLMNCTGANVATVIINGRVVMRDRTIPGLDAQAMHARVQDYFVRMKSAYSERDYQRRPVEALFPSSFPAAATPV